MINIYSHSTVIYADIVRITSVCVIIPKRIQGITETDRYSLSQITMHSHTICLNTAYMSVMAKGLAVILQYSGLMRSLTNCISYTCLSE